MTKKQAIRILASQRDKLLDKKNYKDETWTFHTGSYIKDFFGKDSVEYAYIAQVKFQIPYDGSMSPERFSREMDDIYSKAAKFLENCMETIKNKGLVWSGKPNLLYRISEGWLIFILGVLLTVILPAIFYTGFWFGSHDMSLKINNETIKTIKK